MAKRGRPRAEFDKKAFSDLVGLGRSATTLMRAIPFWIHSADLAQQSWRVSSLEGKHMVWNLTPIMQM